MKRFLLKLLAFIALVVTMDIAIGYAYRYLEKHPKGGETARNNYINLETSEDLLIFGSSRCVRHYNPCILEDSLHCTAYNCGAEASGIILFYIQLCNVLERYTPKMIVYDVMPNYDYMDENDNYRFLFEARRFYGKPEIDSVFWDLDANDRYKMWSQAYRYNPNSFKLVSDFIHPLLSNIKGYQPKEGVITHEIDSMQKKSCPLDSLKLKYLNRFVTKCKERGVQLVFAYSPVAAGSEEAFEPIEEIATKHQIPVLRNFQNPQFLGHKELFTDPMHMNHLGAEKYTRLIAGELKKLIK